MDRRALGWRKDTDEGPGLESPIAVAVQGIRLKFIKGY